MTLSVEQTLVRARSRIREPDPGELSASPPRGAGPIDVREPGEYAHDHLPGEVKPRRGVPGFLIHAHPAMGCTASDALAAGRPQQPGYGAVHPLAGGFEAWRNAGLPTTNA